MAKKRKTLPKDFEELLENSTVQELISVFDKCEIEARGGYSKGTALSFNDCPHELAQWLIEQGADIEAVNDYGYTPLQSRSSSWKGNIKSLIDLGADININNRKGTPLHCAVSNHRVENVKFLLEHGAKIGNLTNYGYGPDGKDCSELEVALISCNNRDLEEVLEITKLLLGAGAKKTERMKEFVSRMGKSLEAYRPNGYDETFEESCIAMDEFYQIFEVEPVEKRKVYDGKSPIEVKASTWQKQHEELWEMLVPNSGSAQTIQGEVIRITGKVARELLDNGGGNWDGEFKKMTDAYFDYVQQGNKLSQEELEELKIIVEEVKATNDTNVYVMTELGVKWVLQNPNPISSSDIHYSR